MDNNYSRQSSEETGANGGDDENVLNYDNISIPSAPSPPLWNAEEAAPDLFPPADAEIWKFKNKTRAVLAKIAFLKDDLGKTLVKAADVALQNHVAGMEDDYKDFINRSHEQLVEKISNEAIDPGRIEQVKEIFEEIKSWLKNQN